MFFSSVKHHSAYSLLFSSLQVMQTFRKTGNAIEEGQPNVYSGSTGRSMGDLQKIGRGLQFSMDYCSKCDWWNEHSFGTDQNFVWKDHELSSNTADKCLCSEAPCPGPPSHEVGCLKKQMGEAHLILRMATSFCLCSSPPWILLCCPVYKQSRRKREEVLFHYQKRKKNPYLEVE